MTYSPQDPEVFVPPFSPSNGVLAGLWDNHAEMPGGYWQLVASSGHKVTTTDAVTYTWELKQRNNAGLATVEVHMVIDAPGTGVWDMVLSNSGATATDTVSTSGSGEQDLIATITPTTASDTYTLTLTRASGSGSATVLGWSAYSANPSAVGSIPNYVPKPGTNSWMTSGYPVAVEHIERLLRGPGAVAADRPHCLFSHCIDDSTLAKSKNSPDFSLWAVLGTATSAARADQTGYGAVLIEDERARDVRVDVLVDADTPGSTDAYLRIGGIEWAPSTSGWSSTTITLGPGVHDVIGSLAVADGDAAVFLTIQVWRL